MLLAAVVMLSNVAVALMAYVVGRDAGPWRHKPFRAVADDGQPQHLTVSRGAGDIVVQIDGETIVRAIKLRNKRKGLGEAGI